MLKAERSLLLMAFTSQYCINLQKDGSLAAEKVWKATVLFQPSTVPATPTAPTITTGPLGSSGSADAMITHGDGTSTGFASKLDALQRAMLLIMDDGSLNNI